MKERNEGEVREGRCGRENHRVSEKTLEGKEWERGKGREEM